MNIKSRLSLASAAVDSRRGSTKKIKASMGRQDSRKVTQSNNFHTIPVKENSSLPTPLDSTHKMDHLDHKENSDRRFSSQKKIGGVNESGTPHAKVSVVRS